VTAGFEDEEAADELKRTAPVLNTVLAVWRAKMEAESMLKRSWKEDDSSWNH
jgi:hypothetical protein